MKLGIIDLDSGNLASLSAALVKLNISFKICKDKSDFDDVNKLILPGVGAFKDFMKKLKDKGIDKILNEKVNNEISLLGVCVGFQVLFEDSCEHGLSKGLSYLNGNVISFKDINAKIEVPHVGWNECNIIKPNLLFDGIKNFSDFYFTHSFLVNKNNTDYVITETDYKIKFASGVQKKNIYGVQFHPEKSQANGMRILKNFYERC